MVRFFRSPIVQGFVLFATYVMTAQLGFHIEAHSGHMTQLWAPTGIAWVALFLFGIRLWPFITLASFVVFQSIGMPWMVSAAIAGGNTLAALAAVYGLKKFDFEPALRRLHDVAGLLLVACVGSSLISACIGTAALWAAARIPAEMVFKTFQLWWLGDAASHAVVAPFLLTWGTGAWKRPESRRVFEVLGFLATVFVLNLLVFSPLTHLILPTGRKGYLIFPPLVWAALRFGPRGVTAGMLLTAAFSMTGAALGWGPFIGFTLTETLINLQVFLAVESATGLVLAAVAQERRHAGYALSESEARFRHAADEAPLMMWMSDPDRRSTYFNRYWLDFTGRRLEAELGDGWTEGIYPDDLLSFKEAYGAAFASRQAFQAEYRLKRFDGDYRWIVQQGAPRFVEGYFEGYVGTCIEIHDRKLGEQALEEQVVRRTGQLAALNRELEAFSYSVSHDLRAPLRAIDGFSRELMENPNIQLDTRARDDLNRVRGATHRMAQLIEDLLNFSRVSRSEIKREKMDLSALAGQVVDELRAASPERSVDVMLAPHLVVNGDAHLLRIALENLLGNAWKFTGKTDQPKIEVGVTEDAGARTYFVRDNGAGFNMHYADKLFGVFQRLHTDKEFPGTGIGLATVQRIIHRHGGVIRAEAAEGRGATFYFTLP